jgi:quercetin dioxygenase-like cupin family protein
MTTTRVFPSADFFQVSSGEPIRSVVSESAEVVVVAWHIAPGQCIAAHVHPHGQDTWTILAGHGCYQLNASGESQLITQGDVVIAPTGAVHGVTNHASEPLLIISVVAPSAAGYQLLPCAED